MSITNPRTSKALLMALLLCLTTFLAACGSDSDKTGDVDDGDAETPVAHTHDDGSTCFKCDATKREAGRLWCAEHERYEDRCWICQPQLEDASRPYCKEHHLYEDECHLCNPALLKDDAGASAAPQPEGPALFCKEHGVPEAECGICQPQLASSLKAGESLSIRMPSARSAELAGLTLEQPVRGEATETLQLLGEVRYNENKRAKVTPLASGVLSGVKVDVGEIVEAGQVLAVVKSSSAAQAKSSYLSALAELEVRTTAYEREQRLAKEKIAALRDLQEAEAAHRLAELALRQASQQLLNLGFSENDIAGIKKSQTASSDLPVRAPFAGTVVDRQAVLGEAVGSEALFEIADLSTMWIELAVPEEHVSLLTKGCKIIANAKSTPNRRIEGTVTWISPQIDERTRMVRARATVSNTAGDLRAGSFVEVSALLGDPLESLQVPSESIHELDGAMYVFVRQEPDLFAVRRVEVGPKTKSGNTAVLAGLSATDSVVTVGSFTMRTEFLKSRLGAGCVDD
ncbi:MAG: efflux RND transporter periplasmic adaptor subunit [Phycisphaeraceae bacterium]|nr:efflux RND transporter periplasmic adaptor subunit [Phycisphaeraceae bacterium]